MDRIVYDQEHWLRSNDPEHSLEAYLEQQGNAYSRIKQHFIRELLGDLKAKRFLDFGCGAGGNLVYAAREGAGFIVGVDAETSALNTARYHLEREGLGARCQLVACDRFSFSSQGAFDVILLKDVIEHVPDDDTLLREISEALSPGGTLILSTQNSFSLNYLLEGTYQRLIMRRRNWCGWDPTHLRFYKPSTLKAKMAAAGLKCETWRSIYIVPHKIPVPWSRGRSFYRIERLTIFDRTLGRLWPLSKTGWNIIVRAVRPPD